MRSSPSVPPSRATTDARKLSPTTCPTYTPNPLQPRAGSSRTPSTPTTCPAHPKVLHGSTVNTSPELRRVVYFDNRAAGWNEKHRWFARSVIEKRCRLYQYSLHERKTNPYPSDDEVFNYRVPEGLPIWNPGDPIDLHAPREAPGA